MKEIPRYDLKIEYDYGYFYDTPLITRVENEFGQYCLAYHIQELQDEIFRLRVKHNDWEDQ